MIPEPPFDPKYVYSIPMESIFPDHSFNCRGVIDPSEIRELARDIAEKGLTQPVVVQPWSVPNKPNIKFRLIAGYRRQMAHQMNHAKTIEAVIREGLTDVDARVINLTENIQRTDLNVLQEAQALEHLKDAGWSEQKIANRISKSRGWVQERFYLLELPPEIQAEAAARVITLKQVRQIWALPSVQQQHEYVRALKDARLAGKKKEPKPESVRTTNEKRLRNRTEVFEIQEIVRQLFGHGLATRVLGWAAGEVDDLEIHQYLAEQASRNGKFYMIPEGLHGRAKVTQAEDHETVGQPEPEEKPELTADDLDDDLKDLLVSHD